MSVIEECIKSIEAMPLNISSTRRSGSNGLRNADELVMRVLTTLAGKLDEKEIDKAILGFLRGMSEVEGEDIFQEFPFEKAAEVDKEKMRLAMRFGIESYLNQLINEEKE